MAETQYAHRLQETFEEHRKFLEERLDPDSGLLDKLLSSRTLSRMEIYDIKALSPFYKRNSMLLDYIVEKNKYIVLIEALRNTHQTHIANYLEENGEFKPDFGGVWPLRENELSILDINQENLIDLIEPGELIGQLFSTKVLNNRQREAISAEPTIHKKNETLLDILRRRSLRDYWKTIECLEQSNQGHVAKILDEGGVTIKIHVKIGDDSPEVDETEDEIISRIASILSGRSLEESNRIWEQAQMRLIAAKKGHSIRLYVFCKTMLSLRQLQDLQSSGQLTTNLQLVFNRLLSSTQTEAEATADNLQDAVESVFTQALQMLHVTRINVTVPTEDFDKCTKYFVATMSRRRNKKLRAPIIEKRRTAISPTEVDNLPLEMLDGVLIKSYLHFVKARIDSANPNRDVVIFTKLASVHYCWFRRLIKPNIRTIIWRHLKTFYNEVYKEVNILRNNHSYMSENIRPNRIIVKRLRLTDCLTDCQARLLEQCEFHKDKITTRIGKDGPEFKSMMRNFDRKRYNDFIRCLRQSERNLIARVAENGGVAIKMNIRCQNTPNRRPLEKQLVRRINSLHDKYKHRSHQVEKLISELKHDDLELLNSVEDRGTSAWIWCKTQKALEKLKTMGESKQLVDVLRDLNMPKSSGNEKMPQVGIPTAAAIDNSQFKKEIGTCSISINFTTKFTMKGEVMGVTKLRKQIHVLCRSSTLRHSVLEIYEDHSPFSRAKDIPLRDIKDAFDLGSVEKENFLFVIDGLNKCVWKIQKGQNEHNHQVTKWLSGAGWPYTLSVSSSGQLLMVRRGDPVSTLEIYGVEADLCLLLNLPVGIQRPQHAIETTRGNFIIIHLCIEGKSGRSGRGRKAWGISEVTRDGKMVVSRFVATDEVQLKIPEHVVHDSDDRLLMCDYGNGRVILFDSNLNWERILLPIRSDDDSERILGSRRLCYDPTLKQLIVGGVGGVYLYGLIHR